MIWKMEEKNSNGEKAESRLNTMVDGPPRIAGTLVATRRPPRNTTHVTTWGLAEEIPAKARRNPSLPAGRSASTEWAVSHSFLRMYRGAKNAYANKASSARNCQENAVCRACGKLALSTYFERNESRKPKTMKPNRKQPSAYGSWKAEMNRSAKVLPSDPSRSISGPGRSGPSGVPRRASPMLPRGRSRACGMKISDQGGLVWHVQGTANSHF